MQMSIMADASVVEVALQAAEQVGTPERLGGLNAPPDAATRGRLEEAWEAIKERLRSVVGAEAVEIDRLRREAQQIVDEVIATAADRASDLKQLLMARLQEYQ